MNVVPKFVHSPLLRHGIAIHWLNRVDDVVSFVVVARVVVATILPLKKCMIFCSICKIFLKLIKIKLHTS